MSNITNRSIKQILVIVIISLLTVGVVMANENDLLINADLIKIDIDQINAYQIPPTIGGYTVLPGGILDNAPDGFAPLPDACDNAAGSYMNEGIKASRTTMISFDDIVYDNKDPELVLYALYAIEANTFGEFDVLFDSPQNLAPVMDFKNGDVVTIGDESVCINEGPFTARLWKVDNGAWAIETIKFNGAYDISASWENTQQNNPQLGNINFDMPVLVEGVVIRYMLPYVEPPITTVPVGGEQSKTSNDPIFSCDGTAPSNLSVGMDVYLDGYGYSQFPTNIEDSWTEWQFNDMKVAMGEYGTGVYIDILNETPLVGIPSNLESVIATPQELYSGINFGVIVDGPACSSMNAEPSTEGGCKPSLTVPCTTGVGGSNPDHDRFYTWWQVDINGEVGWYPEVVGQYSHWLWDQEGMFNRKLMMYYMVPVEAMQSQANACPTPNLYAGLVVEPAFSNLNLRANPNGEVIGRLEMEEEATLFGEPTCGGGTNWWQTERGFLAETDPETNAALLLPAVQQVREAVRSNADEPNEEIVIVTAVPSQAEPQETVTPEPDDDKSKDKDKKQKCDPTTGRGC